MHPDKIPQFFQNPVEIGVIFVINIGGKYYVLDGHHRWSSIYAYNPKALIHCFVIPNTFAKSPQGALENLQLIIGILNGDIPVTKGKGTTNIYETDKDVWYSHILGAINAGNTEEIVNQFKKVSNAIVDTPEEIAKYLTSNIEKIKNGTSSDASGMPPRELMPQTDKTNGTTLSALVDNVPMEESMEREEICEALRGVEFDGWKQIDKNKARKLWEAGEQIGFCPCNLNPKAFQSAFFVAFSKDDDEPDFNKFVNAYTFYNCGSKETGKYPSFCAQEESIKKLDESCRVDELFGMEKCSVVVTDPRGHKTTIFTGKKKECEAEARKLRDAQFDLKDHIEDVDIVKGHANGINYGSADKFIKAKKDSDERWEREKREREWEAGRPERERKQKEFDRWMDSNKKRREEEREKERQKELEDKWDSHFNPSRDDHWYR